MKCSLLATLLVSASALKAYDIRCDCVSMGSRMCFNNAYTPPCVRITAPDDIVDPFPYNKEKSVYYKAYLDCVADVGSVGLKQSAIEKLGCGGDEMEKKPSAPTQAPTPPTQAPTKAPTKPPTEAPTKAPTPIRTCTCHPQPSKFSGLVCFRRDSEGNPDCMSNWYQKQPSTGKRDSNAPWVEKENFDIEKECEKIRPGEEEKGPGELIQHRSGQQKLEDNTWVSVPGIFSCWDRDDPSNPRYNEPFISAGTSQYLSFFAAAFVLVAFFWQ